jgi:hypothetical protein
MGVFTSILNTAKRKYLERMGRVSRFKDFLMRNKAPVGSLFMGLWLWAAVEECGVYFGIDLRGKCEEVTNGLGMVGAFLVGAGVLSSDYRNKFTQGRVSPLEAAENFKPASKD